MNHKGVVLFPKISGTAPNFFFIHRLCEEAIIVA